LTHPDTYPSPTRRSSDLTRDAKDALSMTRYEKTISNLKEVKARSGKVIALATEGDEEIKEAADHVLYIPPAPEELLPILEIVPLDRKSTRLNSSHQIISY